MIACVIRRAVKTVRRTIHALNLTPKTDYILFMRSELQLRLVLVGVLPKYPGLHEQHVVALSIHVLQDIWHASHY